MPAEIKVSEISWKATVRVDFGFSGLSEKHAQTIMRDLIRAKWPEKQRHPQCVYVVRLLGEVAVHYPAKFSPVLYIGEGSAFDRLYGHTEWLVPLVQSVPQLGVEVHVGKILRKNKPNLYMYVEADLIYWFSEEYGSIPWFNRQRETSKEGKYKYTHEAERNLWKRVAPGAGHRFRWAIRPTHSNEWHKFYCKGLTQT
jgi:hypothetical protein